MKKFLISIFLVFLLSACQDEAAMPTPTQLASETATEIATTATNTARPTRRPTLTSTPFITYTPFPPPTPFPFPTPEGALGVQGFSPDNQWVLWDSINQDYGISLIVQSISGSPIWEVYAQDYYFDFFDGIIHPIYWSVDGRYVYLAFIPAVDGSNFIPVRIISRLDLVTGGIADIIRSKSGFSASISDNGRHLAYVVSSSSGIIANFRDFRTGSETAIEIPGIDSWGTGRIIWSPDNSKVIFAGDNENGFFMIVVDRKEASYKILLKDSQIGYLPEEWISDFQVSVTNSGNNPPSFIIDIETGEITKIDE